MSTYRAVQVTSPGKMDLVQRPLMDPAAGRVRLRVEACGICHSDSVTMDGLIPGIAYPRVPGHEVVGRIDALGEGVSGWKIGQRVGVGERIGIIRFGSRCDIYVPPPYVPLVAVGQRMIGGETVLADREAHEPPREGFSH